MSFGGYHPFPMRFGRARASRLEVIHTSLNAQRGTALDTSDSAKIVWIENLAFARAIDAAWSTNARLSHQWDPERVTDMLSRWEKIMGLAPSPTDSLVTRRAALTKQWERFGGLVNIGRMSSRLTDILGDIFVSIDFIGSSVANIHVPDNTYPWGTPSVENPWYSTVMHMLVRTTVPTGYSEQDYLDIVSKVNPLLDGILPAWMTWNVYRPGPISVNVPDGPTAGGFYLDDPHNLNWEVFGAPPVVSDLSLSGWWRASYTGDPWTGTASAGLSSGRTLINGAGEVPTVGAAVNLLTPSAYNGLTNYFTSSLNLSDLVTSAAGTLAFLYRADTAAAAVSNPYEDACFLSMEARGDLSFSVNATGVRASFLDVSAARLDIAQPALLGYWHLAQMRWNAGTLEVGVDNVWTTVPITGGGADATNFASTLIQVGADYVLGAHFEGQILEIMASKTRLSDANFQTIKHYLNERYALSL